MSTAARSDATQILIQPAAADMLDELGRAVSCRVRLRAAEIRQDQAAPVGDQDVIRAWADMVQGENRVTVLSVRTLASESRDACLVSVRNGTLTLLCKTRRGLAIAARQASEEIARLSGRTVVGCLDIVLGWHQTIEGPAEVLDLSRLVKLFETEQQKGDH